MGRDWRAVFGVDDAEHLVEHFERDSYQGVDYRHLTDARHGVERGTAIVGEEDVVVRGYPSVPRTLVLDPGVPEHFDGPVTVEEKLNGYNVRVVRVDGRLLAFTRGGFVCPYTTRKAERLLSAGDFFDEHPGRMLCCELVGPENPYTTHDYADVDSAALRVFDVRDRESGDPMPVAERRSVCAAHGFDQPREFGTHDPDAAAGAVRDAIDTLDAEGREGVVMKSADGRRQLKYTTSAIHRADLAHAFSMPFDYGRDFLFSRVIREAFQAVEFGESEAETRERARALGEAILLPAVEAVRAVERGDPVGEDHAVRGEPAVVDELLAYFYDQGLSLEIARDERVRDERVVEFTKVAVSTRDKTEHYLEGGTIDE